MQVQAVRASVGEHGRKAAGLSTVQELRVGEGAGAEKHADKTGGMIMASEHAKGQGKFVAVHLNAKEKGHLWDWCTRHEAECKSRTKYSDLAAIASQDVGFTVSQSNMATTCIAKYGNRNESRQKRVAVIDRIMYADIQGLKGEVVVLLQKMKQIEDRLDAAGA